MCLTTLTAGAQSSFYQAVSSHSTSLGSPAGGSGDSGDPIISADGRFVLFASAANNLVETTNDDGIPARFPAPLNVYLRDRTSGLTALISLDAAGTCGGNADSLPAELSTNDRFVLFESAATNLVPGDINGSRDVFVRDRESGAAWLVSRSFNGGCGNGPSYSPAMTPDGRYVVFASAASNLVEGDTNGIPDIFVRDLSQGTTTLVSVGAQAARIPPDWVSASDLPEITPDGRYVAFRSTATNLVAGVTNTGEIYVRDLATSTTYWVSTNAEPLLQSAGIAGAASSFNQRISADGQVVAFEVSGSESSGRALILRQEVLTGTTELVDSNAVPPVPGTEANLQNLSMTPDGRFIAFLAETNIGAVCVRRWDAQTGTSELASGTTNNTVAAGTICEWPEMDASGRYVAFLSNSTGLTTNSVGGGYHLYVRDMATGVSKLIDVGANGLPAGVGINAVPALSEDGSSVAFACPDSSLLGSDDNHDTDVFVKDLATDAVELVSAHHPNLASQTPNGQSFVFDSCVSSNGQWAAFVSAADNLVPDDTNGMRDVFVRDLSAGTNLLVTVAADGGSADGISTEPAISGNGRYVAFTSYADNLVAGDNNDAEDVFVRNLQDGTTRLVSVSTNGVDLGNGDSFSPEISDDGRYVLFQSTAQNLTPGTFDGQNANLFLRDMVSNTTRALTQTASGASLTSAAMTPDGHYVAFIGTLPGASQASLYVWDTQQASRVYTNNTLDLSAVSVSPDGERLAYLLGYSGSSSSRLRVVDRISGVLGSVSPGPFPRLAGLRFSRDGRFLVYATVATNAPSDGNSLSDVYLYDFQSGTNLLVSRSTTTGEAGNEASDSPDISPDGRYVVYRSEATDLVPSDGNDVSDIFLYDRLTGATTLVTANRSGSISADSRSFSPKFSADGTTLLWTSWASDLVGHDYNHFSDVFAFTLPPTTFVDTDQDGMDDQWELDHFHTLGRDGTKDYDHDGASDLFEFQTGTDPTDPNSFFRGAIVFTAPSGPGVKLTWTAAPGKSYRIQWKDSLSDPTWHDLNIPLSVLGNTGTAVDPAPSAPHRFYRIGLVLSQP